MRDEGMNAEEINKLMSIPDLKSTMEGKTTIYSTGEFGDMLEARQYKQQLANKVYLSAVVIEDDQEATLDLSVKKKWTDKRV